MSDGNVFQGASPRSAAAPRAAVLAAVLVCALGFEFRDAIARMFLTWITTEEYSYGILMPFIAAYLCWQRRATIRNSTVQASWSGLAVIALGVAMNILGRLATVYVLEQYALVVTICGVAVSIGGWRLLQKLAAPLLLLVLMVPLPNFLSNNLSAELQLLSSQLGVLFIRMGGVSVFLDGNVIDLGSYQLEVAEACSGLRYLFPLMTLGLIMAWLFKAALWKRVVLFLSSMPLTILMNSLRIGIIGVLVDRWGVAMAEGVLHDVEGWVIFLVTAALMLFEVMLLSRLGSGGCSWRSSFASLWQPGAGAGAASAPRQVPLSVLGAVAVLLVASPSAWALRTTSEKSPARAAFSQFPRTIGEWQGRRGVIEQVYLDVLQLDDYIVADYARSASTPAAPVNLYVAWYNSQSSGQSAHSPRSCLPGGGWTIRSLENADVAGVRIAGVPLRVNRAVIEKGASRQLVYYWFQQRGRIVTNEFQVKWFLFWDALNRHRTDGALVRLVVAVPDGTPVESADRELRSFASAMAQRLEAYVPS